MNTELFQKIDAIPEEAFDMSSWANREHRDCGTTRCMAGWAIHFTTGQPLFDADDEEHPSVQALAETLGVQPYMEILGRELLGLDRYTAGQVFYLSNQNAKEFISLAAQGRDDDALEFLANVEE